ncbi:MAG: hypothetical protein U5K00_10710 [Melioribacteraceae bacterium]|nr:hypothetical protein [Melioribacteraceae bacterium]
MIDKFESTNVVRMAITAPESFEPIFVFSAQIPKYAARIKIAQSTQIWFESIKEILEQINLHY